MAPLILLLLLLLPFLAIPLHANAPIPSPSPAQIHQGHFHLFEDYADFEDLLAMVEEDIRMHKMPPKRRRWPGESRGKGRIGRRGPPRQFGAPNFDPSNRKRRSEGRFPVSLFPTLIPHSQPASVVRSGRIFPSPQIVQRFRPPAGELPAGQVRVEASSLQSEYPEWLALHAGGSLGGGLRGPIRARSYRELLLHALNRAQAELSRRHRLYSAEGPKKRKKLIDGESRKKKKKLKEKDEKGECQKCGNNWRVMRAANGGKKCCQEGGMNGGEGKKKRGKGKERTKGKSGGGRNWTKLGGGNGGGGKKTTKGIGNGNGTTILLNSGSLFNTSTAPTSSAFAQKWTTAKWGQGGDQK